MTTEIVRKDKSIHPRVVSGRTAFAKVNTRKAKNPATVERVVNAIQKHLEKHPHDRMSQAHVEKLMKAL